ncbi:hypothetical protein ACJMK2_028489, partial [Sinanodonta woodiana]
MGNKLCAPLLKKSYPPDNYPWHIRKDSHLLRLWAEIFQVHGDGEYMQWARLSEDVVPINITCIEDNPKTVFQITAYNRHVEKIFDVKVIQPGTILCPATECFVHWRDQGSRNEWGLNFSTLADAKRFRDCCSYPTQKFARKSSSANSLRLSPPKGKGRAISSPNSPVNNRRVISSPHELMQPQPCECIAPSSDRELLARTEKSATIPRTQHEAFQEDQVFSPRGILKQPSDMSMYDNVSSDGRTLVRRRSAHSSLGRSSARQLVLVHENSQNSSSTSASAMRPFSNSGRTAQVLPQNKANSVRNTKVPGTEDHLSSIGKDAELETRPASSGKFENVRLETAFIGNADIVVSGRKSVTLATLPQSKEGLMNETTKNVLSTEDLEESNNIVVRKDRVWIISPQPQRIQVSEPTRQSSSSESPEWPSPPEPLTPSTPLTPVCNIEFDSDSIRKMLQSLPISAEDDSRGSSNSSPQERDLGFIDEPYFQGQTANHRRDSRTNYSNCDYTVSSGRKNSNQVMQNEKVVTKSGQQESVEISGMDPKLFPKCDLPGNYCARDSYGQDSNPDSGFGGMVGDGTTSLCSAESVPSSSTVQASCLDVKHADLRGGSSGGSSHGSSSSQLSDSITQLIDGLEIKQFLSTGLSDDEAGSDDSIHTVTEAESQFSYAKQQGAIRKAGWMVVKNWLIQKKRKLELAPRRSWKKYWVCLKGTVLLFFDCNVESEDYEERVPKHILVIEGAIAQAVPEHPKRENIFSLSTAFGDAYLLQTPSQTELDLWVCAIHSACAASFARQHGKDNTLKLLKTELQKLETNIDIDIKMRKMAELQLKVVTDPRSRHAIIKQIHQWEENLEKLFIEQYRFRCYSSSLQGSELPNPKVLLSSVSKQSKSTLSRLGIFTVSSFHALVCARKPLVMPNLYGKGNQKGSLLSPSGDGNFRYTRSKGPGSGTHAESVYKAAEIDEVVGEMITQDNIDGASDKSPTGSIGSQEILSKVNIPNNQTVTVRIHKITTVQDILEYVCNWRQLNPRDHYVRVKLPGVADFVYPDRNENVRKMKCEVVDICQKCIFQIQLTKSEAHVTYGIKIEAELAEDCERDDDLRIYIREVIPGSLAQSRGLIIGDEILVLNGKVVSELDMVYVETILLESQSLCLTVRSLRSSPPPTAVTVQDTNKLIEKMTCPPPPSQPRISDKDLGTLVVPSPSGVISEESPSTSQQSLDPLPNLSPNQIDALLKGADQVTAICREPDQTTGPATTEGNITVSKHLSETEKLKKVIMELIETERAYVKDLNCLIERYLEPLKEETFLTSDEMDQVFGNIQEIVQFQRQFLLSLEESIQLDNSFLMANNAEAKNYRRVLFSLGGSFLYYANHFKVYSSFCASHSRSQKILNPDIISDRFKEFLNARNPKQQHSSTLQSYLIKPIQRILKYPLLLQQLCNLTDQESDEHHHLSEALKQMEAVAEHINEMQKIFEEYGSIFDELSKMFRELYQQKKPVDLSVGELQMYGTVEWCNVSDSLGKVKKGADLESMVFVFKSGVVFLCRERLKRRKSRVGSGTSKAIFYDCNDTVERFRTLIPVQEVQVRTGKVSDIDGHYWWELVHLKSETDAKPERVYQFCNSTSEAKTDFMRIIRQIIRDCVRKMTIPGATHNTRSKYIPYGGKRLEALSQNARTISNKRKGHKNQDTERHSMEFEEKFRVLECESAIRTRSRTVGDLNDDEKRRNDEEI